MEVEVEEVKRHIYVVTFEKNNTYFLGLEEKQCFQLAGEWGISGPKGVKHNYDKSIIHLPRQHTYIYLQSLINQGKIEVESSNLCQIYAS